MRSIYIVLTFTGTFLATLIKGYTRKEFAHVSISLDKELEEMYSFGRLNPYNPFKGGFVHEHINSGTFGRFKNTTAEVYRVRVTETQYEKIKETIKRIENEKDTYFFNYIGLFAIGIKKRISYKNRFYCAEFVKYVLDEAGIADNLPDMISPEDFRLLDKKRSIYKGKLREYRYRLNKKNVA